MDSFVRNYQDNSTEAGFAFTFYCDNCNDGFKSDFIESSTYKKGSFMRAVSGGAGALGSILGGAAQNIGWGAERAGSLLGERFDNASPEWQREHEAAFEQAQADARPHFHRCHNCNTYVDDNCWNKDTGLCVACSPRQEIYVAQAHAQAMKNNIDEAASSATVWKGEIEAKTTTCPSCGQPTGAGKFCNNCGASLQLKQCPSCGAQNAQSVNFCNNCGSNLAEAALSAPTPRETGICPSCNAQNQPGTSFCGECGTKLV